MNTQMGRTIEITGIKPTDRNVLLPNYGILIRVPLEDKLNLQQSTPKPEHKIDKCPVEWLLPKNEGYLEGHFYFTIEAETTYGKMFQSQSYYLNNKQIKCGTHTLLNQGINLNLNNWYNWRDYRWDLWGKFEPLNTDDLPEHTDNIILKTYHEFYKS